MDRPNCRRCGGALDLVWDAESRRYEWSCNNLRGGKRPAITDELFESMWARLSPREMARLTNEIAARV